MPSNYEKLSRPTGPSMDTSPVAVPCKAALSNIATVFPSDEKTPRLSNVSSPHSDKSVDPFDTDLEAMAPINTKNNCLDKSKTRSKSDCQVWPGRNEWKQNAKLNKKKKGCNFMSSMSCRNRIICKVIIAFLIIGIAVGVGVGISKPLGAPIWGDKSSK